MDQTRQDTALDEARTAGLPEELEEKIKAFEDRQASQPDDPEPEKGPGPGAEAPAQDTQDAEEEGPPEGAPPVHVQLGDHAGWAQLLARRASEVQAMVRNTLELHRGTQELTPETIDALFGMLGATLQNLALVEQGLAAINYRLAVGPEGPVPGLPRVPPPPGGRN